MTTTEQLIRATGLKLWADWTTMWNGKPELALELVAPKFALHLAIPSVDPATINTPETAHRWVAAHIAKFKRLSFHTEAGPFVDTAAGVVAGPWYAKTDIGEGERLVCGMDTIAFRDGKITEYWTMSMPSEKALVWAHRA